MAETETMAVDGWEQGDLLGLDFPVHLDALRQAGPAFLTTAFRAAGTLDGPNRVTAITQLEPFSGGSTGQKALLGVTYEHPGPHLPDELFIKFSRDLDDPARDRGKRQMESEVRFGLLSQLPAFPVAVPRCMFGEYDIQSGSGILISERIRFGVHGIEPHHPKARDHEIDDQLAHYEALVSALGRLAGSHRAGRFPAQVMAHFQPRVRAATGPRRDGPTPDDIRTQVLRYADFATRYPRLLPAGIRSDAFIQHLLRGAPRSIEHAAALRAAGNERASELTAFCHWNANIDNAWFWRDEHGDLACGLLDWGNVGQLHLATALWSCLVFAEPELVVEHLDHLIARFSAAYEDAGGRPFAADALKLQFRLHSVIGGLQWPLGAVALLERRIPDLASVADRFDPRVAGDEFTRTQLHLLTASLLLWEASDPADVIDGAIRRAAGDRTP